MARDAGSMMDIRFNFSQTIMAGIFILVCQVEKTSQDLECDRTLGA